MLKDLPKRTLTSVPPAPRYRSLLLSDLHLGALGAQSAALLEFLSQNPAENYMLVGDILHLDTQIMDRWNEDDQAVVEYFHQRHLAGSKITYLRGNHDPEPDSARPIRRLPVLSCRQTIMRTADGKSYLLLHGDEQDVRILRSLVLRRIGSYIDSGLRAVDIGLRWLREHEDNPASRGRLEAVSARFNQWLYRHRGYERRLVALARQGGHDGVICGHFHIPAFHEDHGLLYANCGDWVDSRTALAEDFSGKLHLLRWCPVKQQMLPWIESAQTEGVAI